MYEDQTYEEILNRCLLDARDDMDKTEGSVLFTAIAPAAAEFAIHYIEMNGLVANSYADTCDRDHLILRCKERGIYPNPATKAILKGEFNVDIGVGQRFSLDELNYISVKYIGRSEGESGLYLYQMECETAGTVGNKTFGELVAIEHITNLKTANLTDTLIPAEDEEETEALRTRYFSSFETDPFGGNKKDYINKTNSLQGVGATKVIPAWDGGGTVKLIIVDSNFAKASKSLVDFVQEKIDPLNDRGNGSGIAPIGHVVTVVSAVEKEIKLNLSLVYAEGYNWSRVSEEVMKTLEEYMLEMRKNWATQSHISVRLTQIESRLLKVTGIFDVTETKINGKSSNFDLESDEIPVLSDSGVIVNA